MYPRRRRTISRGRLLLRECGAFFRGFVAAGFLAERLEHDALDGAGERERTLVVGAHRRLRVLSAVERLEPGEHGHGAADRSAADLFAVAQEGRLALQTTGELEAHRQL